MTFAGAGGVGENGAGTNLAGAVLCGGRSTRMGRDKATLTVDGEVMAVRVAGALRGAGCTPVLAIGGRDDVLEALGLYVVPDVWPGDGPLGGILTALDAFGDAGAVVVVSCDLPWLTSAAIYAVVAALGDHDVAIAVGDRPEPLCAVWRPAVAGVIRARFDAGERAVHRMLATLDVGTAVVDPGSVRNVNTPADLRRGTRGHEG